MVPGYSLPHHACSDPSLASHPRARRGARSPAPTQFLTIMGAPDTKSNVKLLLCAAQLKLHAFVEAVLEKVHASHRARRIRRRDRMSSHNLASRIGAGLTGQLRHLTPDSEIVR